MIGASSVMPFAGFFEALGELGVRGGTALCGYFELCGVALKIISQFLAGKSFGGASSCCSRCAIFGWAGAGCRFLGFRGGIDYRIDAIGQAFQLPSTGGSF